MALEGLEFPSQVKLNGGFFLRVKARTQSRKVDNATSQRHDHSKWSVPHAL